MQMSSPLKLKRRKHAILQKLCLERPLFPYRNLRSQPEPSSSFDTCNQSGIQWVIIAWVKFACFTGARSRSSLHSSAHVPVNILRVSVAMATSISRCAVDATLNAAGVGNLGYPGGWLREQHG
ncbi:hypothetical protein PR048_008389 [Dryococelus australis]|uniref:Uncharacterized protein n=1 Tax=Dryococelus australis TaxID=614101 RepID=A0ABQ9HXU9_9NEOP|nr:hypothetical protein PR048_008389 [Dryococelus australis]